MKLQIQLLRPTAQLPKYMSEGAAGMDITADIEGTINLAPGGRAGVATGLAIALPIGFEAQVRPRSGLARDHGVTVLNSPGTIDSDYRGEIVVLLVNHGSVAVDITRGMRIAQLVIAPVVQAQMESVTALSTTQRGAGGFGSTGG
jgi:dUTP pyrophosphatase